jgi:hypothetical protein
MTHGISEMFHVADRVILFLGVLPVSKKTGVISQSGQDFTHSGVARMQQGGTPE